MRRYDGVKHRILKLEETFPSRKICLLRNRREIQEIEVVK